MSEHEQDTAPHDGRNNERDQAAELFAPFYETRRQITGLRGERSRSLPARGRR